MFWRALVRLKDLRDGRAADRRLDLTAPAAPVIRHAGHELREALQLQKSVEQRTHGGDLATGAHRGGMCRRVVRDLKRDSILQPRTSVGMIGIGRRCGKLQRGVRWRVRGGAAEIVMLCLLPAQRERPLPPGHARLRAVAGDAAGPRLESGSVSCDGGVTTRAGPSEARSDRPVRRSREGTSAPRAASCLSAARYRFGFPCAARWASRARRTRSTMQASGLCA